MLPEDFIIRMKKLLGEEYEAFARSLEETPVRSLRVNPLKEGWESFVKNPPFALTRVPWTETGYYYKEEQDRPGKHPYHEAGVYYIQEASAMAPAAFLKAQPGERVLDLCAAPGGKSTQIAANMRGEGLLVCNEIHPARAKILSENIERMGVRNALVTNETPERLADALPEFFDRILVDAPCSGEGMFARKEEAREEWSVSAIAVCAARQDAILDEAARMLRPGGRLVYSTCTFAPEENEGSVSRFLKRHADFKLLEPDFFSGMERGRGSFIEEAAPDIGKTVRLWPHKLKGQGHFAAALQKDGDITQTRWKRKGEKGLPEKEKKECRRLLEETADVSLKGVLLKFGDQLYLAPEETPGLSGLKVLRPGLHLGALKKNRLEPSHALALAASPKEVKRRCTLSAHSAELKAYLGGRTFQAGPSAALSLQGENGWYLITADGYGIGWGKLTGDVMKNHYPKGLRKND